MRLEFGLRKKSSLDKGAGEQHKRSLELIRGGKYPELAELCTGLEGIVAFQRTNSAVPDDGKAIDDWVAQINNFLVTHGGGPLTKEEILPENNTAE